jgi:DNA-binding MarR family transcriptional regulator
MADEPGRPQDLADGNSERQAVPGATLLGNLLLLALLGYGRRVDAEMAAAGFTDRKFPETPVLRLCSDPEGITISEISQRLGITRQGASKTVGRLRDRGYLAVTPSPTSGREKIVTLSTRALEYLTQQHRASKVVEAQLRGQLGDKGFEQFTTALGQLADGHPGSMDALARRYDLKLRPAERGDRRRREGAASVQAHIQQRPGDPGGPQHEGGAQRGSGSERRY